MALGALAAGEQQAPCSTRPPSHGVPFFGSLPPCRVSSWWPRRALLLHAPAAQGFPLVRARAGELVVAHGRPSSMEIGAPLFLGDRCSVRFLPPPLVFGAQHSHLLGELLQHLALSTPADPEPHAVHPCPRAQSRLGSTADLPPPAVSCALFFFHGQQQEQCRLGPCSSPLPHKTAVAASHRRPWRAASPLVA
jgi:hypothetical protein